MKKLTHLSTGPRPPSIVTRPIDSDVISCNEKGTLPLRFSSPNLLPQTNYKKNIRKRLTGGSSTKFSTRALQNCQDYQKLGSVSNFPRQEEPKET